MMHTENYLDRIDRDFGIRNSKAQKEAFRDWALAEAKALGVTGARAENDEKHENLVFGDPEKAKAIFTAHYDTPRRMLLPNFMLPENRFLFWAYNLGITFCMLMAAIGAAFAAGSLLDLDWHDVRSRMLMLVIYGVVYAGLFYLVIMGPVNKRNRNDNTSGTAAVMELMRRLGEDSGAAFILFDDEEKGKKGSKAYAKAHPIIANDTFVVNLDCVGNGDTFVFGSSKRASEHELYALLEAAARETGLQTKFYPGGASRMNSDHRSFKLGVGVCACSCRPFVGYYAGRIHTGRDTVADPENIRKLADALAAFAKQAG